MNNRIEYIDGMRAIGALLVVFCHLACAFVPGLYYPDFNNPFEAIWHGTPLNVITNANSAVQLFFLLSGYMVTMKTRSRLTQNSRERYEPVIHKIRNSLRITIPAILLSFILMRFGLYFHLQVVDIDERFNFLIDYCSFVPTWKSLVKDNIFVLLTGSDYVGPLWTMPYDFAGTILCTVISAYTFLDRNTKSRKWIYFILSILFMHINSNFIAFFVGGFVYEVVDNLEEEGRFNYSVRKAIESPLGRIVLSVIGLYCATMPLEKCNGIYVPLKVCLNYISESAITSFGLGILLLVILQTPTLQKILSIPPLRILGKYSAYIYAFHWQIILSVGCFICVSLYDKVSYKLLVVLISSVCIILTVISSVIYVKLYQKIKKKLVRRKERSK